MTSRLQHLRSFSVLITLDPDLLRSPLPKIVGSSTMLFRYRGTPVCVQSPRRIRALGLTERFICLCSEPRTMSLGPKHLASI